MIQKGIDVDAVVQDVVKDWDRLKRERLIKEDRWNECRLAGSAEFGKTWTELANYRSKRYVPLASMALDNVSSRYMQMLFPNDDWFKAEGRTPDDMAGANLMESLSKYQMAKVGLRSKLSKLIYLICQYGNYPFAVHWRKDTVMVPDSEQMDAAIQGAIGENGVPDVRNMQLPRKEVVMYEGPDLMIGDIFDFVVERNPDDDLYSTRIHRFHRTKDYLLAANSPDEFGNTMYENLDDLTDENRYRETSDNYKRVSDVQTGMLQDETDAVEILEKWGNFYLRGPDGKQQAFRNYRAVVGNRRVLLAFEENPYAHGQVPWRLGQFGPSGDHVYSFGAIERSLGLQDDVNVRSNQIIDAHTLMINPMWKYKEDGALDVDDLISAPGNAIRVSDIRNLEPIAFADFTGQGMQEVGFMMAQFNQATGAQSSFATEAYKKSATEVAATSQSGMARDVEIARYIEHTVLRPILTMWFALNQQLLDDEQVIKVATDAVTQGITDPDTGIQIDPTGPLTVRVSPEQIAGEFDVYPVGVSQMAATQTEIANLNNFLQVVANGPMSQWLKPGPLINAFAKRLKIYDAWQFIKTPQEMQIEQQQQLAMEQAQQSAQQGQPGAGGGPGGSPSGQGGGGTGTLPGSVNPGNTIPDGVHAGQRQGPMAMPG